MNFNFDTPEKTAAQALGIGIETLKKRRSSGEIPDYCWLKLGYRTVRYCLPLLQDWAIDSTDLEAQARAREALQATRPSNLPRKRGPKTAA
jgi:hypothetical protein